MTPRFYKLLASALIISIVGTAFNLLVLPRIAPPQVACLVESTDGVAKAWGRDCYRGNVVMRFEPK